MEKFLFAILLSLFLAITITAQNQQKPCSQEQAKQFDFWLGTWDLEWTDAQGKKQTGTNIINKILGGCVIEENFDGGGSPAYLGKSHSLFDAKSGMWKQTWVDSGGDYLDFVGEFKDGKMMLRREFVGKDGKKVMQRMIFSNIQKDSLEWNWERSDDDGKTWKTNWKLNYKRRASSNQTFDIKTVKAFIDEANKVYGERFTKNDAAFYVEKYTKDACIMPENTPEICGRENIRRQYYANGENSKLKITITPKDIIGGADTVVEIGGYEVFDEGGKSLDKGKFIATWRQEDGMWKLHREIWNSDIPK